VAHTLTALTAQRLVFAIHRPDVGILPRPRAVVREENGAQGRITLGVPEPLPCRRICMSQREQDLQSAQLRQLAAKCRRLATELYDRQTVTTLRQIAVDYDRLAQAKEQEARLTPPPVRDA